MQTPVYSSPIFFFRKPTKGLVTAGLGPRNIFFDASVGRGGGGRREGDIISIALEVKELSFYQNTSGGIFYHEYSPPIRMWIHDP